MSSPRQNLDAALAFRREGKSDAAVKAALEALEEDPALAGAWECVASIYMKHGQWKTALSLLKRALECAPDHTMLEIYHALALAETGALAAAETRIDDVLRRAPDNPHALFAKAEILAASGFPDRALPCYAAAQRYDATRKAAALGEASARFMTGDFLGALPGLSAGEEKTPGAFDLPLWNGEVGAHVLLYGSQGFGDIIMFLRYVKHMPPAQEVTLRIPWQLAQLARDSSPDLPIVASRDPGDPPDIALPPGVMFSPPPDATARFPLIRLSWITGAFEPRAANVPYLRADAEKTAVWEQRLAALPRPYIGLVWSGSPRNRVDHQRSVPFETLLPLIAEAKPHLVSLQMGPEHVRASEVGIFDATPFIGDFSDSAALLQTLDLLITVDTAAAHLAGSLGRPVWMLVPFMRSDWRWLLAREDTIWYPSMHLFRQTQPRDWSGVVECIAAALEKFLAGDGSVLSPPR